MLISSSTRLGIVRSSCLQALRSTHLGHTSLCVCMRVCVQSVHMPHPLECLTHQIYCSVYFQSNGLLCCHCCPGFKVEVISIVWANSCAVCNVHGPFLSSVLFPVCTSPATPPTGNYCMCLQAKLHLSCPLLLCYMQFPNSTCR